MPCLYCLNTIYCVHDQTAQGLQKVRDSLETLAQSVDDVKKQKNEQMEASVWYQSLQSGIQSYNALVKEYEEKKSSLSISLYGEWVQQRNQLQQQLKKVDSVRTELQTIGNQIKDKFQKLLDLRRELIEKRRKFLDQVIGASAFVRMELVQFGDVSSLEETYRNLLNLGDNTLYFLLQALPMPISLVNGRGHKNSDHNCAWSALRLQHHRRPDNLRQGPSHQDPPP